jgi:hypothetical protein
MNEIRVSIQDLDKKFSRDWESEEKEKIEICENKKLKKSTEITQWKVSPKYQAEKNQDWRQCWGVTSTVWYISNKCQPRLLYPEKLFF